jgi:hypothetical protein
LDWTSVTLTVNWLFASICNKLVSVSWKNRSLRERRRRSVKKRELNS